MMKRNHVSALAARIHATKNQLSIPKRIFKPASYAILAIIASTSLTGCANTSSINPWGEPSISQTPVATETNTPAPPQQPVTTAIPPETNATKAKVALLLPLSGKGSDAGQDMLNAAQLALFDLGDNAFELMPRDTGGTQDGARIATETALRDGAQLILGPVFANDVRAASPVTAAQGKSIIAFSTDWTVANSNTFVMSFLPHSQVKRITEYAAKRGMSRIALIAANDAYGNIVTTAFDSTLRELGLQSAGTFRYDPTSLTSLQTNLRSLVPASGQQPIHAILIAADPIKSAAISAQLTQMGLPPTLVKRLGTGLWDDPSAPQQTELQTAWYAAVSPQSRSSFENNYKANYGKQPLRIASLAYDATALAAVLAKSNQGYNRQAILNPNGFAGIDGIFRFRPDGLIDRGLSILEIQNKAVTAIDESPRTFQVHNQ